MGTPRFAVSLAAAPMTYLDQTVRELESAGADVLHFDVEDGSFIPMLTLGTRIIGELRPLTRLPFDVHLAVRDPEWILPELKALGADWVSVHWEACPYPHRTLGMIRSLGLRAGLAFNPATSLPDLRYLRSCFDFLLFLTNEPEYPHAPFLPEVLAKLPRACEMLAGAVPDLEVDGGINPGNVASAVTAGATIVVCGRSTFRDGAVARNLDALRKAVDQEAPSPRRERDLET